jgi:hypothetical protein
VRDEVEDSGHLGTNEPSAQPIADGVVIRVALVLLPHDQIHSDQDALSPLAWPCDVLPALLLVSRCNYRRPGGLAPSEWDNGSEVGASWPRTAVGLMRGLGAANMSLCAGGTSRPKGGESPPW